MPLGLSDGNGAGRAVPGAKTEWPRRLASGRPPPAAERTQTSGKPPCRRQQNLARFVAVCGDLFARAARGNAPYRRASVDFGIDGEQFADESCYDATPIAAIRIGCLPGNARNAVAMAAIAANTQADRKT
jgi:hypothetical protein